MASIVRSRRRPGRRILQLQKPRGELSPRVQAVGPDHFAIVSVDGAKRRSRFMLADFYGRILIPPTTLPHTDGDFQAAIQRIRQAVAQHDLRDLIVAIERTGTYHQPVRRTFASAGWETRLVHPLASQHFRQVADPGDKTDDHDLGGIHRATVNGFGLLEAPLPADYELLQTISRQRRDLVHKTSTLRCQIREYLHALMPGYADCFEDLWASSVALPLARQLGSAAAVRQADLRGLQRLVADADQRCHAATLLKIKAWADNAPPANPNARLHQVLADLHDDLLAKIRQIQALERESAAVVARLPYVRLLIIPGINVVSTADLAGELGPPERYANANNITGRAGLMPSRYQSDAVDRPNGPLRRWANRRLRTALMQIADNLVTCNDYFHARSDQWRRQAKDPRWIRVKVAKIFSRLAFALVVGPQLFRHRCCQQEHTILDKLLAFHREHDTPMSQVLADLEAAVAQLPRSAYAAEAKPLQAHLEKIQSRRRGPQLLADVIPIVLVRLGITPVQSVTGGQDPS